MSMPKIECREIDKCCAASSILQSIALQEAGLAHIINAEGEKLQRIINSCDSTYDEIIHANVSVESMIEKLTSLELVLKNKMDAIIPVLCACDKEPKRGLK